MTHKKSTISPPQLAALLIATTMGSSIVFIPNPLSEAANNDAWMSLVLAYVFGMLVLSCVIYLYRKHDGLSLIAYSRRLIGNALTMVAAVPVIGMLVFAIPAINAGIGDFSTSIMMNKTPAYVFNSISLIIAAMTIRAGISVTARMFVLLIFILVVFSVLVIVIAVPLYEPGRLLPFFDEGIKPMLHGVFISAGFPFGEVVLFSMVLPFVRDKQDRAVNKHLYTAFTFSGVMLTLSALCTIMAFGAAAGNFKYSLFSLAGEVQVGKLFQRIEMVIGIALILGSYMKETVYLFILNQILVQLFRLKTERALVYPLALICTFLSLTMFADPADFEEQVYVIWPFTIFVVGCTLIFLLTFMTWISSLKTIKKRRA